MKFVFDQMERWCDAWTGRLAMAVLAVGSLLLAAFALPVHAGADATLSVINPQVNVGSMRLESRITLPGVGAD